MNLSCMHEKNRHNICKCFVEGKEDSFQKYLTREWGAYLKKKKKKQRGEGVRLKNDSNSNLFGPFFSTTKLLLHYISQDSNNIIISNSKNKSMRVSVCLR